MLRLLTLNLNYHGDAKGPWPQRRELVRKAIEECSPDVVFLQAVRLANGEDQAHELGRLLNYPEVFFQPAVTRNDGSMDGSAMLSKLPLLQRNSQPLGFREALEDDNRRVIQHAVVEIGSRPLHLFNAHFSWVAEQARDNIAESAALLPQDADAVLAGDLNTPPESALFQPFRDAGFVDAWAALHPGEDGYTFEADKPFTRIDYFWLSPGLAPQLREVERLNPGGDGIWLSDHMALAAGLAFPPPV